MDHKIRLSSPLNWVLAYVFKLYVFLQVPRNKNSQNKFNGYTKKTISNSVVFYDKNVGFMYDCS